MNPLSAFSDWLIGIIQEAFTWLFGVLGDFFVSVVRLVLNGVVHLLSALPVPDFLSSYSMGSMFGGLDPGVLYFVSAFRVPECIALIGLGFGFRMLRKLFTLGQW